MTQKNIIISIPEPCHENWDNMTPAARGRFCSACQKEVVDFTGMSDTQILDVFMKAGKARLCGRYNHEQLNRAIVGVAPRLSFIHTITQKAAALLLLAQSVSVAGFAQHTGKHKTEVQHPKKDSHEGKKQLIIKGMMLDSYGWQGIEGVDVVVKGTNFLATTRNDGRFSITLPDSFHSMPIVLAPGQHHIPFPDAVTYFIDEVAIDSAMLARGDEIVMYRYAVEQLPDHIIARPKMEGYRHTYAGVTVVQNINSREIKRRSLWQRITSPFRRKVRPA